MRGFVGVRPWQCWDYASGCWNALGCAALPLAPCNAMVTMLMTTCLHFLIRPPHNPPNPPQASSTTPVQTNLLRTMRMLSGSVVGRRSPAALLLHRGGVAGPKQALAATVARGTSCSCPLFPKPVHRFKCACRCPCITSMQVSPKKEMSSFALPCPTHPSFPASLPPPRLSLHERQHPPGGVPVDSRDGSVVCRHGVDPQCRQVGSGAHFPR